MTMPASQTAAPTPPCPVPGHPRTRAEDARHVAGVGLQVAVANALIAVFIHVTHGNPLGKTMLGVQAIGLLSWAVILVGRRWLLPGPPERLIASWRGRLLVVGGCIVGYVGGITLSDLATGDSTWQVFALHPDWIASDAGMAALFSGIVIAWFALRERAAQHRAQLAAAAHEATLARLAALQSQLEPHMLFNTLANLRALIAADPARAQAMLDRLIDFLRATLAASRAGTHALGDEFARLDDYLALMQVRMGERLRVERALPPELAALPVPAMLLQPLVENAIRHGLEPRRGAGLLRIVAAREGDALVLRVEDTGQGLAAAAAAAPEPGAPRGGFGLAQVRERLHTLHGAAARLAIGPREGGGTVAEVRLPFPA